MSVYRVVVGRRGVSIPARASAKVKTLLQGVAGLLCLAPSLAPQRTAVLDVAVWVAVAFTVVTGAQYLFDGRRASRQAVGWARYEGRDRGGGHRAAPRADHRHQLAVDGRAPGRWPASTRISTRRWGTTARIVLAFRTAPWPAATGSSSAVAWARPTTTSPARPSPR